MYKEPTMTFSPPKPAILIAGAGPSGLILALTLAQNGVPFRIIDKDASLHVGQRGAGIQPRSLEMFNFLGLATQVIDAGISVPLRRTYKLPGGIEPAATFYMTGTPEEPTPAVPFPNAILIGQSHLEELIRAQLAGFGIEVERGVELLDFEQDETGVWAHVLHRSPKGDRTEVVPADWIVSAEGGRSVVRKNLGLTFVGETRDQSFVLADMYIQGLGNDYWHSWGDGTEKMVLIRPTEYPGLFSIMLSSSRSDLDVDLVMNNREAFIESLYECMDRRDLIFGDIVWQTKWTANIRMANQFSRGRAFLVGDAAHIHTPAGAQGTNTGMQDAFNLAWKLSLVYKGLASPSLLRSYNDERLPVAKAVLDRTTAYFQVVFKTRDAGPRAFKQLGVNYRWSSIVVDEQRAPSTGEEIAVYLPDENTELHAGDRAPNASGLKAYGNHKDKEITLFSIFKPTHHTILIFEPAVEELQAILVALQVLPKETFRITIVLSTDYNQDPSALEGCDDVLVDMNAHAFAAYRPAETGFKVIVVRPDGAIGSVARGRDGITKYLEAVFDMNVDLKLSGFALHSNM